MDVDCWYGFGYPFEQMPFFMHGVLRLMFPHGPCTMQDLIVSNNSGYFCVSGHCADMQESMSDGLQSWKFLSNVTKIWICGKPRFWNSMTYTYAKTALKTFHL